VSRAAGWLTESRREGDDLVLTGRLRSKASGTARIELSRAKGLVSHAIEAEVKAGVFTARVPLARIALDVDDDNHASGLYADHFLVDLAIGGKEPSRLVAGDAYVTTRAAFGTDEVYTAVNDSGQVSIRTRPLGPVVTSASWNAAGALELAGDSAVDVDGELLLRLRGRRKDLAIGLRVTGGRWAVTVDPAAVPGPAGSLPMTAGVWDLAFRSAGRRHTTIASLGVVSETRMTLPLRGDGADGTVGMLRRATDERATLTIEPPAVRPVTKPAPAELRSAPLREAVLFDAAPGRRFADDPAAMVAELGSRPGAPVALWAHERGQAVPEGAEPVLLGSPAWQSALATSRWIVTNDDLPRWFEPRPEQVVLRLGGGWPVARAGALATAHPLGDQLIEQVTGDARKWTALASPGRSATPVLREEFRYTGEVLEYGRPGGDLLQTMAADEAHAAVLAWLGLPAGTRLVLYAPTRRPMDLRKRGWSDPGRLLNLLNVVEELPEGYRLLVRRHPAVDEDVLGLPDGAIEVSAYPRASELLLAADVLITDYSALLADYASTGRPVLLHVPDLDEFAASPGLNVDFADHAPGPLLGSSEEVVAALRDIDVVAADHEGAAKAFAVSHPVDGGGRAAANLVDWLLAARR
jgi:CDP-glycerol glycerophosphotransferase